MSKASQKCEAFMWIKTYCLQWLTIIHTVLKITCHFCKVKAIFKNPKPKACHFPLIQQLLSNDSKYF